MIVNKTLKNYETRKHYAFAELYESMTDTQKDQFLAETENS